MDIIYRLQGLEFEWDVRKARSNIDKHGVTFEEAAEVFFDPFCQYIDASVEHDSEQRDMIIGYSFSLRILVVVNTERGERIRIVSARVATAPERRLL